MPSGSEFPRWPIETVAVLVARPSELPVSSKAINRLNATQADYFGDVILLKESHLYRLFDFDQDTMNELSIFLGNFDLKFGMEIPGWSKARADKVRKIIESNLPNDVALNSLIKTLPAPDANIDKAVPKVDSTLVNEAVARSVDADEPKTKTRGHDFTQWPLETLALLVSYPKELPLSVRATNCLYNTGCKFFGEVILLKEADLLRFQNLGRKTAKEISDLIHEFGLHFEMTIPGWSIEKASEIRNFIVSRLPRNVAITNLIVNRGTSKIELLFQPTELDFPAPEESAPHFLTWPIEQRALLIATPAELLLSPRTTNALSHAGYIYFGEIAQLSIHDLLKVNNFGRKSADEVSELLRRNGLELGIKIPGWSKVNAEICRKEFGDQFRKLIGKHNLDLLVSNTVASGCLEDELQGLIKSIVTGRNAEIGIDFWGFNGSSPKTLDAVGKKLGITRERVRQITSGIMRRLEKLHFSTPFLNRALEHICESGPGSDAYLANCLQKNGISKTNFSIDSLVLASTIFKRETDLRRIRIGGAVLFLSNPELDGKEGSAILTLRKHSGSNGCTNVNRIAAEIGLHENEVGSLRQLLTFIPEVLWLDDEKEWLSSNRTARNRLSNLVVKVLSVATEIRASELRRAVSRSQRLEFAPPTAILKRFCTAFELATVNGELIRGIPSAENIQLIGNEKILLEAFRTKGTILSREELEQVCIDEYGLNPSSFYIYLSFSPLITRLSRGIYCLVGSTVDPGQIESIERQRQSESKTPEYGWASDGKLWCAYPLSRITIHSGGMRLPQFVADLVEGEWLVVHNNKEPIGSLRVKNNFATGLRKPLIENGAEPDDLCLLVFDLGAKRVELQLGGPDAVDQLTENVLPHDFMSIEDHGI